MNKETPNDPNCTHNKIFPIFLMQIFKRMRHLQPCNYPISMPGLKDNIYKISAIMSINDTSTPHDMQVIGSGIVRNYIPLLKPN
jgi:hypothetical protein